MGSILDYNAVLKIRLLVYMLLMALGFVVFVAAAVMKVCVITVPFNIIFEYFSTVNTTICVMFTVYFLIQTPE